MSIRLFGLTGGIASGKSAVAARWRARGLPIIDADELAREVVSPGSPGLAAVVEAFGRGILDESGALDRKGLASIVFADEGARKKLESITHPAIALAGMEQAARAETEGHLLGCYEAALLVERGLVASFRPLVVVTAPPDVQIARAVARGGLSPEEARARVAAQSSPEEKTKLADYVIDNTRDLPALGHAADQVLDAVCAAVGVDPGRYPRPIAAS